MIGVLALRKLAAVGFMKQKLKTKILLMKRKKMKYID